MTGYPRLLQEIVDHGMLCAGRAANITHWLLQTSHLPGAVVELGCHAGVTGVLLAMVSGKQVWLYDSFEGLPPPTAGDLGALKCFKVGALKVSENSVYEKFSQYGLPEPTVHKGWFNQLGPKTLPEQISFAHLDGDLYTSILDSLERVYPRMVSGAVCVIDDYGWSGTPGVYWAVHDFMRNRKEAVIKMLTGNANTFQGMFIKV